MDVSYCCGTSIFFLRSDTLQWKIEKIVLRKQNETKKVFLSRDAMRN